MATARRQGALCFIVWSVATWWSTTSCRGGWLTLDSRQLLCHLCNSIKGDATMDEARKRRGAQGAVKLGRVKAAMAL